MKIRMLLYPLWLRSWHWINATLFVVLIATGISLHYSATNNLYMSFESAIVAHNTAGILLSLNFIFYTLFNIISGNYKQYIPPIAGMTKRLILQGRYYVWGVFRGEEHPYHTSEEMKFNPLQQVSYFGIMFILMPIICISGTLLMFPELAPEKFLGMGGVWPMAIIHIVVGYFLSLFMFGHIYLATHGDTLLSNFKSMFTGYHEHTVHKNVDPYFDDIPNNKNHH